MTEQVKAVKYPSTNQFSTVIKNLINQVRFAGLDENGNATFDYAKVLPTLQFIGTVKIHGTNASLIQYEPQGKIYCQSKERLLGVEEGDNSGFFNAMSQVKDLQKLFDKATQSYKIDHGEDPQWPIEIAGEWAGAGIQRGVAVSEVEKFFTIFRVGYGFKYSADGIYQDVNWESPLCLDLSGDYAIHLPEDRIFNSFDFKTFNIEIDLNCPERAQPLLAEITEGVEKECPVGEYFGISGVGEGVVWTPVDNRLASDSSTWFKVKGKKHSSSKVKTLAAVDTEKLDSIDAFVEYAVTENRMIQGFGEVEHDVSKTGEFIKWVMNDVFKEERESMEASGLTMKDISKAASTKARKFFLLTLEKEIY